MSLDSVRPPLSSFSNRNDKASKAFSSIQSHRALLSACTTQWEELEQYFYDIEQTVHANFLELSQREKAFESKISEAKAALDEREAVVSSQGQASLAFAQNQNESAIAAVLDDKKEQHGNRLGDNAHEEPVISASVAMAADLNVPVVKADNSLGAASTAIEGSNAITSLASEVTVRPELQILCEKMDSDGLRNFVVEHRKDLNTIRNEFLTALQGSDDPCLLVLKAVEGYHDLQLDPSRVKETEAAIRRACVFLLECLAQWLSSPVVGRNNPVVPSNVKESVKIVAKRWRSRIDANEFESPLDAHAFLQLLATFEIAADFPDDDLCKFVTLIARRKQTPALCRSLGLTAKAPGLVDTLAKDGKQMEALAFAHSFGLMERLHPVPMLKSYLDDVCKEAEMLVKSAPHEAAVQDDAALKELFALRAVINAVEEYDLGSRYPTQNLHKRVVQLEKEKLERKRAASAVKQHAKKFRSVGTGPRASSSGILKHTVRADVGVGNGSSTLGQGGILNGALSRGHYAHINLGQYGGPALSSYGQASQSGFEGRPEALYGSPFVVGNSSLSVPNLYQYPQTDVVGSALFGSTSAYSGLPKTYGNYQFGSGLTPNSFLR